jgi:hypothetical protein
MIKLLDIDFRITDLLCLSGFIENIPGAFGLFFLEILRKLSAVPSELREIRPFSHPRTVVRGYYQLSLLDNPYRILNAITI